VPEEGDVDADDHGHHHEHIEHQAGLPSHPLSLAIARLGLDSDRRLGHGEG
jgi:hypothetical protein